jgi:hypothetical protein
MYSSELWSAPQCSRMLSHSGMAFGPSSFCKVCLASIAALDAESADVLENIRFLILLWVAKRQGLHSGLQDAFDLDVGRPVSEPCCWNDPRNTLLGSSLSQNSNPPLL